LEALRNYKEKRREKHVADLFTRKEVEKKFVRKMYKAWRTLFLKRSSLRFLSMTLDEARVRIALHTLKNY
jgi:hypothetical protein